MQMHNNVNHTVISEAPDWITIKEAVKMINRQIKTQVTDSDIYRNVLYGNIQISIYFQSPIKLRKIKFSKNKVKFRIVHSSRINRLCYLDRNSFLLNKSLIVSTDDNIISPRHDVIDVPLLGHEYIEVKKLLAQALNIPLPKAEISKINHGISALYNKNIYQVFECTTWRERIKNQIEQLPANIISPNDRALLLENSDIICKTAYFPVYDLPEDACFVLRRSEINKLIHVYFNYKCAISHQPRISTPLSRLFWLACRHNDTICPLIQHPYKLLPIFEQWALMDGITDRLSGDTLKTALQRGCPHPSSS